MTIAEMAAAMPVAPDLFSEPGLP